MRDAIELLRLDGRVALVTGGAGHIGATVADALAEMGCALVLLDFEGEKLEKTAAALAERRGVDVLAMGVDLESTGPLDVASRIEAQWGRLDIMVHAAALVGTSPLRGWAVPFEEQDVDTWRRALEVNLTAPFRLTQSCASLLRASGRGSVINIGSIYGVSGPDLRLYGPEPKLGNPAAYAASKGGLIQLTRWMATVLAPEVRVNAVSIGGVYRQHDPEFVERYVARTPLGRMATEEDLKGPVLFLASDASSYVTGQNMLVDGGWTTW